MLDRTCHPVNSSSGSPGVGETARIHPTGRTSILRELGHGEPRHTQIQPLDRTQPALSLRPQTTGDQGLLRTYSGNVLELLEHRVANLRRLLAGNVERLQGQVPPRLGQFDPAERHRPKVLD